MTKLASLESLDIFSSRLDIDLDALAFNYGYIKDMVSPAKVIAVVKANAVGHGQRHVARALESLGVDFLGVSNFLEGVYLREAGIRAPVLVFNGLTPSQMARAIQLNLSFFAFDEDSLVLVNSLAKKVGLKARVHLKVDTGMGRLGFLPEAAHSVATLVKTLDAVEVEGIASHLASPYVKEHDKFSWTQFERFLQAAKALDPDHRTMWHFAASSGTVRFKEMWLDAVRVGALLYGVGRVWPLPWPLKPVASYRTQIAQVKRLPRGHNIGYRLHYTAPSDMTLAIVPVGTADGLTGEHADGGEVLIHGKRCRIVGICSCEMMVDVTGLSGPAPGDEVVIIGRQGDDSITAVECAEMGKTGYANVLTRISTRVPRVYFSKGKCTHVEVFGDETP